MAAPASRLTVSEAEYLAFDLAHEGRHEFVNGEILAMAGGTVAQARLARNAQAALDRRTRHGPCEVFGSDLRVRIDETGMYAYPDVMVVCGELQLAPTTPESLLNPRLVVEVLSPSTRDYDLGAKAAHYRLRPSVEAILFLDSERAWAQVQTRTGDGAWRLSDHVEGSLEVIGLSLPMAELWEGVLPPVVPAAGEQPA